MIHGLRPLGRNNQSIHGKIFLKNALFVHARFEMCIESNLQSRVICPLIKKVENNFWNE